MNDLLFTWQQIEIPEDQRNDWFTIDTNELGLIPFENTLRIRIVALLATEPYEIRNICGFACVFDVGRSIPGQDY